MPKTPGEIISQLEDEELSADAYAIKQRDALKKKAIDAGLKDDATLAEIKYALKTSGGENEDLNKLYEYEHGLSMDELTEKVEEVQSRIQNRIRKEEVKELLKYKSDTSIPIADIYERLENIYRDSPTGGSDFQNKKYIKEYLRRYHEEKCLFYVPNFRCEDVIDAFSDEDIFMILFSAANGLGKTALLVNIFANVIFNGINKTYFDKPIFTDWKYPKKFRITSTEKAISTEIIPAIREWFPEGRYKLEKKGKTFFSYFEGNGWIGHFMTYDQRPSAHESTTLGLSGFDEPPPKDIYDANVFRMRLGGKMICTAVPLTDAAGMDLKERFEEGEREYFNEATGETEMIKNTVRHIEGMTEDACEEHGKPNSKGIMGHLTHKHIVQMAVNVDEETRKARMSGKVQRDASFIFQEFDRKIHVIDAFDVRNKNDYVFFAGFDPHPRKIDALLWLAVDKDNRYFVVDELWEMFNGVAPLASAIQEKEEGMNVLWRIADPSVVNDKHSDDINYMEKLHRDYGIYFKKGEKRRDDADNNIIDALHYEKSGTGKPLSEPQLHIFRNCVKTIEQIERYNWVQNNNGNLVKTKKNDDFVEALGRLLLQNPRYTSIKDNTKYVSKHNNTMNPLVGGGVGYGMGVGTSYVSKWM